MSNIELRFEYPWLLLLLIPALALILIPYFRLPMRRRKMVQRIVPTILHCVMALILTILLAGLSIVRTTDNQAVILLLDYSDSTQPVRQAINDRAQELEKQLRKTTSVSTIVFGGDCSEKVKLDPTVTDATDLAAALEYAAAKLPEDKIGRIILLSDGKQTDGDAEATAQYLRAQGVRIDAIWFDSSTGSREVQIGGFTAPATAYVGSTVTLTASIESNSKSTVNIDLYDGDTHIQNKQLTVDDSGRVLSLEVPVETPGLHSFRLVMAADQDTLTQNNQAVACVDVVQAPHVLIIAGTGTDPASLEEALASYAQVTVCESTHPPRKIAELCNYDGIILMNVHTDDLPKNYGSLLNTYVSSYGRSLIALGGQDTFMYGGMRDTVYEEMMPVSFSLSRTSDDEAVALMIVMDCSLSMSQQSTYMSVAKQGSIKCVESMTENDYVGIISFNQSATVEAPLEKNTTERKASLNRIISGLTTSQGTYYTDALALAHQELLKSDAQIRHILFVSDGGPADTAYKDLLPGIAADGISISTIALGHESTVLSEMATSCGGTYYFVQESTDLPNIMLSLTQQVSVNSYMTGSFLPVSASDSPLAGKLPAALPVLEGYLGTTLKRGAELHMTLGEGHPLYATWTWGKGTVACFTSDLDTGWSRAWLANKGLIQDLVAYALPQTHSDTALSLEVTPGGQSIALTVQTPEDDNSVLTLTAGGHSVQLPCIAPGTYQGRISTASLGVYPITITQTDRDGNVLDTLSRTLAVPTQAEYDAFADDGSGLLKSICTYTGGTLNASTESLAGIPTEPIRTVSDFRIPFGITFALLLLADIAIRKLRWKDIKNLWLVIKNRK